MEQTSTLIIKELANGTVDVQVVYDPPNPTTELSAMIYTLYLEMVKQKETAANE